MAPEVVIHTGFWGCGAYGGHRVLMALLQLLAANLSRVDRLVFHSPDPAGTEDLETARRLFDEEWIGSPKKQGWVCRMRQSFTGASGGKAAGSESLLSTSEIVEKILAQGFQWGTSDGN